MFLLLIPAIPAAITATVAAAIAVKAACTTSNHVVTRNAKAAKKEASKEAVGRAQQPGPMAKIQNKFVKDNWPGVGPVWLTPEEVKVLANAKASDFSSKKADAVLRWIIQDQPAREAYMAALPK
jgi:hypothetical protein